MEEKRDHMSKKVLIAGILAAVLTTSISAVFLIQQSALAQTTNGTTTMQPGQMMISQLPQINGSVNVQQQASKFIQDNVKVPFNTAASTAQSQVDGGTVVAGHLGVAQGYLVYIFNVANYDAGTSRIVIVDAGNGSVLYTSDAMSLHFGGMGGGCPGGFGGMMHHHLGMNWGGQNKGMMTSPSSGSSVPSSIENTSA